MAEEKKYSTNVQLVLNRKEIIEKELAQKERVALHLNGSLTRLREERDLEVLSTNSSDQCLELLNNEIDSKEKQQKDNDAAIEMLKENLREVKKELRGKIVSEKQKISDEGKAHEADAVASQEKAAACFGLLNDLNNLDEDDESEPKPKPEKKFNWRDIGLGMLAMAVIAVLVQLIHMWVS